ncbi:MAG: hypothetical protein SF029_15120 [bacterium]|nr:hypothetical protein [bacterium]
MPIMNEWYAEGRVFLTRFVGEVTLEEMIVSSQEGTALSNMGRAPVYNLIDLTQLEHFPLRIPDFQEVTLGGTSRKLEWIIVYGVPGRLSAFLASMFNLIMHRNYLVVASLDEALRVIDRLENQSHAAAGH